MVIAWDDDGNEGKGVHSSDLRIWSKEVIVPKQNDSMPNKLDLYFVFISGIVVGVKIFVEMVPCLFK